jgi:membrane-associated phospholipid phosphatase
MQQWTPLAAVPFLYVELRWIIPGAGRPHADALVAGWDTRLVGFDAPRTLAVQWHYFALSELLHLCYIAYYAIVYVPPALLWWKGRHREFAATVLAIVIVYTICFVAFVLLPVDGPRFLSGPSAAPDGPVRTMVVRLLAAGSSRGTAFPSAHVAASVVSGFFAFRFLPRVGVAIALLTAGMIVGAVYGGYHYVIDVIAGVVTGLVAAVVAQTVEKVITARVEPR